MRQSKEHVAMIERAACSWHGEDRQTSVARARYSDAVAFHDAHGDDLGKSDSWLCVCGRTDPHGSWETTDRSGKPMEPTTKWVGYVKCTECGRIYDQEGFVVRGPEGNVA